MSEGDLERGPAVLVVDDDETVRLVLRQGLESEGFLTIEAGCAAEGIAAFETEAPDVVLLDVVMPGMDGYEACRELRRLPGGDAVPIVMLTGADDVASIRRSYEAGATDFATKPVSWVLLAHRLRYLLRAGRAFQELRKSETRLEAAQRIARLGHWEWDPATGDQEWSAETFRLLSADPATTRPSRDALLERVHDEDRGALRALMDDAARDGKAFDVDHRLRLPDGVRRHVHTQGVASAGADGRPWVAGTIQDITERKLTEERVRFLAYFDSLTELPNRVLFGDRLEVAVTRARKKGGNVAVLFMDLDDFKRVNDTLGHSAGDALISQIAARLRCIVRSTDSVARSPSEEEQIQTLARVGGDEFIVCLGEVRRGEDAARVARRMLDALERPFRLGDQEFVVTASIGISLYPGDGDDGEALLKSADTAMFRAKDSGKNSYRFFDSSMNQSALRRFSLENTLRRAIERREMEVYFQPQVAAVGYALTGFEALVRWHHPDMGLIAPGDFLQVAEETGLIVSISEWVLRQACLKLRAWNDMGRRDLKMGVNISGRQFRRGDLLDIVQEAVMSAGISPADLEIEITETILVEERERAQDTLRALQRMGIRVAIDDFGTGYSSLAYLRTLPIDTLKIDRSFVSDLPGSTDCAAIVEAVAAMARRLGLTTVAEGVETEGQAEFLGRAGCEVLQGYRFGRPVAADEAERDWILATASDRELGRPAQASVRSEEGKR